MYVSVYMSVCVCECVYECVCMCVCECECMRACMCACSQTTYEQTDPTENNSYTSILYAAVTNPINTGDSQREGRPEKQVTIVLKTQVRPGSGRQLQEH